MNKVSQQKYGLIIKVLSSLFLLMVIPLISTLLYSNLFPLLYNKINSFTKRGEDHDGDIDFINTYIIFFIYSLLSSLLMSIIYGLSKAKGKK